MNKIYTTLLCGLMLCSAGSASAQFNLSRAVKAGTQAVKAFTITDEQMAALVKESVDWMDKNNPVPGPKDPYTVRLNKLTASLKDVNGIPLNFKVYDVIDVNAFACPDGSVRVFSSLMDLMTDDELLGVIGHEIGHVAKHHSKNAYKQSLMTSAAKDAIASAGGVAAKLTDSQLGELASSLMDAKYSQKQEKEADDSGYDFLVANGKNPYAMALAFEKMKSLETGNQSAMAKMFSSHPDTSSRIKHIQERCKKDGYSRPDESAATTTTTTKTTKKGKK